MLFTALVMFTASGSASASFISEEFCFFAFEPGLSTQRQAAADASASQYLLTVSDTTNAGEVKFTFVNNVGVSSSIADIYWDDPEDCLTDLLSITNIPGAGGQVAYDEDTSPDNFPAGNNINFTEEFQVEADNPAPANGLSLAQESLEVVFSLDTGKTAQDVIDAMNAENILERLRVGFHVIAFEGEFDDISLSFVTKPNSETFVPVPTPLLLISSGMLLLVGLRRRV